jgi:excisionase family DNA binding protein
VHTPASGLPEARTARDAARHHRTMPGKSQQPARRYASVDTAAEIYDVNPRTVRRWISEGRITGYKIGAMLVKVDLNEVEEKIVRVIPAVELPIGRTRVWAMMTGGNSLPSEPAPPVASPAAPWRGASQA